MRGMKIVRSRSAERSPWIITPVSAISSRPVSRSRTMSAPWPLRRQQAAAARATSSATCSAHALVGRRHEPRERAHPADPLEGAPQLRLEDDDEGEEADDARRSRGSG